MARVLAVFFMVLFACRAGAEPLEGRLKTVRDTATLRIAYRTDSRPFSFLDPQGQPTGYTIELCERIGKSMAQELDLPSLAIKWVPVDVRSRFQAIIDGAADLECGSTSVSFAHEDCRFFQHRFRGQHGSSGQGQCRDH